MGKKKREQAKDQRQEMAALQCNKGKACKFKRSFFSEEDDVATSAILLLACIVCSPST
ncbi:hypothetical protein QJS04_geneDACA014064 [Acorus gramineus]|uniref:Uncharacterized protein n=1 Tax=Acorus gramineus TaxID=55184 RepID=A0AAV9B3B4_ACOGR|nr:hypothetical protein QJS04_geneDACA014064 [Acorus gramineus]